MKNFYRLSALFLYLSLNLPVFSQVIPCDVQASYTIGGPPPVVLDYNLSNSTISTCSGNLFDPGGTGNYANGIPLTTMTICSDQPGEQVILDFTGFPFQVETNYDFLRIYNGVGTGGTLLWNSQTSGGATNPGVITSTTGCLTITFSSDGSVTYNGWQATISCTNPPLPGLDCNGGDITLTAVGVGESNQLMNNNFNTGTAGPGWNSTGGASFGSPCGANPTSTPYYWASTAVGTPQLTTIPFDVSCGGSISFDMAYSTQGGPTPCEGPDLPNEGVTFQYSTNGGATWVVLGYWDPLGGYDPFLTSWNTYTIPIPPAAAGPNTMFQWIQLASSGTCCDNWGLDNVNISSPVNCAPYVYDWNQVPGTNDNPVQTQTVTSTTTFTVWYGNGIDNCFTTVTVVVPPGTTADAGPDQTFCFGGPGVTIGADPICPDETATYVWSTGATGTIDLTGGGQDHGQITVSPAVTTTYYLEVTYNGCTAYDTVVVYVDMPPTASNPAPINVNCIANVPVPNVAVVTTEADDFTVPPAVTYIGQVSNGGACPEVLTRTYRVTDACGNYVDVNQTITIMVTTGPVVPPNGSSTVACLAAATQPAAPVVVDQCGNNLVPVIVAGANPPCEGTKVYTYTYTDCAGNAAVYTYTYTIDRTVAPVVPANGSSTVSCLAAATQPAAPVVVDQCGNNLVPVISANANPACEGTKVYTYTYTDCSGLASVYTYTYTIDMPVAPVVPANGSEVVACIGDVYVPTPPAGIVDMCGNAVVPVMTQNANPICVGNKIYTFTYTDCAGNVVVWTYTFSINDNIPPTGTAPADLAVPGGAVPAPDVNLITEEADNCTVNPTVTFVGDVSDNGNCPETITRTYRITDDCGNFIDVVQILTIGDAILPTASNPANINVECLAQVPAANPNVVTDEADNGAPPIVTFESEAWTGSTCPDVLIRTYRVTDDCGNFILVTQNIIVEPATAPVVPANGSSIVNCLAAAQVQPAAPVVTDVCGNVLAPVVTVPANSICEGTMAWVFTYTDCAGNTSAWTYTYTIDLPAFVLPANGASTVNCLAAAQVQPVAPVMVDACGNAIVPVVTVPANLPCEGTMAWVFTYTDCAGNTADWTYTYTIDILPFTLPVDAASTVNCLAAAQVQPTAPVMTDMCGNALVPVLTAPANLPCEGTMAWVFTYTDCAGNTADWTYTYTIDLPAFILPANGASTVNCVASAQVQPAAPAMTDVCGNAIVPVVTVPANIPCEGTMAWVFTYTDCAGNTADWTYTYTIDIPAFAIPYPNAGSVVNCLADANVQPAAPGAVLDQCGNVLVPVITAPSPSGCTGMGADWIFTYTDCAGNTADWTYTYTINLAPFVLPFADDASTVNCLVDAQVQPVPPTVVNDVCGNAIVPTVTVPANIPCEGTMAWVFTYTDCAGNTADWTYTYTIDLPAFILPANAGSTVNCLVDAQVQPVAPVMTDVCGNVIVPVVTVPANLPCEGTMPWVFTYTDCAGNTADWTYTYTIDIPAFILPANAGNTVNCLVDAQVQPVAPVMTDVCGNAIVPVVTVPANIPCEGTMAWVFTYTDCAGNTADWTYTYTIDIPAFVLPANAGSTVNCLVNAQVQPGAPAMTDMCGNALVPVVTVPANLPCEGTMAWVFTYTDCAGNTADWTYTYTIDIPAFVLPADAASTVNCLVDAQVQPVAPAMTDMCGNVLVPVVSVPANLPCEGTMAWVFTYTDCAGNTADWTYTYTIDIPAFTIPYPNDGSVVNCVADANVQPAAPGTVVDQCGNVLVPVITAPSPAGCTGMGADWIFTYTDCAGNTADWTYTYTINLSPFALPFADDASTVNCLVDAQVQPIPPGVVNDVCGNAIVPTVAVPANIPCEGSMAWVFTYTDCAGNTLDWTYTYTIDIPAFTLASTGSSSTIECLAQVVVPVPPVVADMCGNALVPVMVAGPDPVCEGDKVFTFTYTDCAGNTADWTYTYTLDVVTSPVVPANGSTAVACITDVFVPVPPAVTDVCGNALVPAMTENADPICVGDKIYTFTYTDCAGNSTAWTYTYSINDNTAPTASNPAPVSVPGSMDVPAPDINVVLDEADNCTPIPVVAWVSDVSDGNVCNLEVITRTYSITDDCGNISYVTQEITILATNPPIDAGADVLLCAGESVTLTAGNPWGVPISWNPSNPPVDGQSFIPTQTATYTVTADNLGCISTDDVTITVEELPVVSFMSDVMGGCAPLEVNFTNTSTSGSALVDCSWEINGEILTGCNTVTYIFENGGYYDVSLTTTSVNGCTANVTYTDYIFVEEHPVASFTPSTTELTNVHSTVSFNNTSVGATTYQWSFGDNLGTTTEFEPTHEFPDDGAATYSVQLVAYSETFGCTDTAWLVLSLEEELLYYIPNTFTPDNDSYNETFKPVFTSGFDPYDFDLFIYNRWGEILWESHDASIGWDGTYGGQLVQEGTYIWKIEFKKTANDEHVRVTGHVNIIK